MTDEEYVRSWWEGYFSTRSEAAEFTRQRELELKELDEEIALVAEDADCPDMFGMNVTLVYKRVADRLRAIRDEKAKGMKP